MNSRSLVLRAAEFAADKHRLQRRASGDTPYINHLISVTRLAEEIGGVEDPEILAAALLHDTLEDTDTGFEELVVRFGRTVANVVAEVTDDKSLPKVDRKKLQIVRASQISEPARTIKLADKLHNLTTTTQGPIPSWSALRVRGYLNWGYHVVEQLGPVNEPLFAALRSLFQSSFELEGHRSRVVPDSPEERAQLLREYYQTLNAR